MVWFQERPIKAVRQAHTLQSPRGHSSTLDLSHIRTEEHEHGGQGGIGEGHLPPGPDFLSRLGHHGAVAGHREYDVALSHEDVLGPRADRDAPLVTLVWRQDLGTHAVLAVVQPLQVGTARLRVACLVHIERCEGAGQNGR